MRQLYQYEGETDELLVEWSTDGDNETQADEWKEIQNGVQRACVEMYQEVEGSDSNNKVGVETRGKKNRRMEKIRHSYKCLRKAK